MADVNVATVVDAVSISETVNAADSKNVGVYEGVTLAESVSQKKALSLIPSGNVLTLQSIGEVNWLWTDSLPGNRRGIKVHAIVVMAAGAETFVLRDGSITGPVWFKSVTAGAAYQVYQFGGVILRPVMCIGDQTGLDAASRYAIIFEKP